MVAVEMKREQVRKKLEIRGQLLELKFDISTFVQGLNVWNCQLNLLKPSQYLEDTEQKLL